MPTPKERGKLARNLSFLRHPMGVVFHDLVDQSVMRVADAFTVVLGLRFRPAPAWTENDA
jgi:hypothetical protein